MLIDWIVIVVGVWPFKKLKYMQVWVKIKLQALQLLPELPLLYFAITTNRKPYITYFKDKCHFGMTLPVLEQQSTIRNMWQNKSKILDSINSFDNDVKKRKNFKISQTHASGYICANMAKALAQWENQSFKNHVKSYKSRKSMVNNNDT